MAMIAITCPACVVDTSMPARALMGTVDLAGTPRGHLSWTCLSCGHLITADIELANLLRLLAAGVPLLDDGVGEIPDAPEAPDHEVPKALPLPGSTAAPLTLDDVLALHELLATDDWFEHWARPLG